MSFVSALLLAACLTYGIIEPARGLECYKSTWSNPTSLTFNDTLTVVCTAPAFRFKRQDATTTAPDAAAAAPGASEAPGATAAPGAGADVGDYCFTATVKNETHDIGVERGCKSGNAEDKCVTLDATKNPNTTVDKCTACNKDKCNGNGASTAGVSLHCVLLYSAIVVKLLSNIKE